MGETRILNWNVEWASPRAKRFPLIRRAIDEVRASIIVVTEGSAPVLPDSGHVVTSSADYGYSPADRSRRKVLMWSREPWRDVDVTGSPLMPGGRFVAGTTDTAIGTVRVIGVCIPWRDAHVRSGRKDRQPWEDHLRYLDGLEEYLRTVSTAETTIIAGDFNQRIPATGAPAKVSDRLAEVFRGWQMVTADVRSRDGDLLIDHMAIRPGRSQTSVSVLERIAEDGTRMSDHHGVIVQMSE